MAVPRYVTLLRDCLRSLDARYPTDTAKGWDAVGLVWGELTAPVRRVLVAVDPTEQVAAEAIALGADLLVCHHPLFLTGVHGFAPTTPGGRTLTALVKAGCALVTCHTNADVARPGVNDALAAALGLPDGLPALVPAPAAGTSGLGRIGDLDQPQPLRQFADLVAAALPPTAAGLRIAGDPEQLIHRVAVCGGSGGGLARTARAQGADVLVTADLKHHATLERPAGLALIDAGHWATEWPWCEQAARLLTEDLARDGKVVTATASTLVTDPWTLTAGRREGGVVTAAEQAAGPGGGRA